MSWTRYPDPDIGDRESVEAIETVIDPRRNATSRVLPDGLATRRFIGRRDGRTDLFPLTRR